MLELPRPLSRVLDGPGLLVQRLTAIAPRLDLRNIDTDQILLSMAETDPDCIAYLNSEGLLRGPNRVVEDQAWHS